MSVDFLFLISSALEDAISILHYINVSILFYSERAKFQPHSPGVRGECDIMTYLYLLLLACLTPLAGLVARFLLSMNGKEHSK